MKHTKDPFEAAYVEQEESPPESPIAQDDYDTQTSNVAATPADSQGAVAVSVAQDDDDLGGGGSDFVHPSDNPSTSRPMLGSARRERINKMRRKSKITWMLSFGSWLLLLIQIKWPTCRLF
uniref:Uncharacterized protein n=1 Tax=Populus trichocarpa TaxID=3694 RepID=A0A3N7G7D0_POPTR